MFEIHKPIFKVKYVYFKMSSAECLRDRIFNIMLAYQCDMYTSSPSFQISPYFNHNVFFLFLALLMSLHSI